MNPEMEKHLTGIRDRKLPMWSFRYQSDVLADYLVEKLLAKIPANRWSDIVPVLIFRASLVFLPPLVKKMRTSPIGFVGLKRDEKTAVAEKYYCNLPQLGKNSIVAIFDPMLGTAGTLRQTLQEINKRYTADTDGIIHSHSIYFVGFLAAESGYRKALMHIPGKNVVLLAVDPVLDANHFISPGLGDFGDRYFGC